MVATWSRSLMVAKISPAVWHTVVIWIRASADVSNLLATAEHICDVGRDSLLVC
jgi:hypothetical protein